MKNRFIFILLFLFIAGFFPDGWCADSISENSVYRTFQNIMKQDISEPVLIYFVDANIDKVSPEIASSLVVGIESVQRRNLPEIENDYYPETVQERMFAEFGHEGNYNDYRGVKDKALSMLLEKTLKSGYKIQVGEGFYYPIIDYELYKKYQPRVTADIRDYIDIRAGDSMQVPMLDAALVISWDEVLSRAGNAEQFLKTYPKSSKYQEIKEYFLFYLETILYGANNTPVFDYSNETMDPAVLESYRQFLHHTNKGWIVPDLIDGFLSVSKRNDYQLTPEVDEYRRKTFDKIKDEFDVFKLD